MGGSGDRGPLPAGDRAACSRPQGVPRQDRLRNTTPGITTSPLDNAYRGEVCGEGAVVAEMSPASTAVVPEVHATMRIPIPLMVPIMCETGAPRPWRGGALLVGLLSRVAYAAISRIATQYAIRRPPSLGGSR